MRRLLITLILLFLFLTEMKSQCITAYPSIEDFELNSGGWSQAGTNPDWSWGSPVKPNINGAGSGNNCWIAGGLASTSYSGSQKSWIESPCYDFSSLQNPYLSFLIFWDTERQYDGGNLQYSLNNGTTWNNLGSANQVQDCLEKNWFNNSNITNLNGLASPQHGWSGTVQAGGGSCLGGNGSGSWKEAAICLMFLAGETNVQFRFTFCSGSTCNNYEGIAIDLFSIAEAPVPQPSVILTCNGGYSVALNAASTLCPKNWKWFLGDPTTPADSAATQQIQYTYPGPGTYTVTLEAYHQCSSKGVTTYDVIFPLVSVLLDSVNCENGNDGGATASSSGVVNPQYTWGTDPVSQSATVNNLTTGVYSLSVSSDDGCTLDTLIEIPYAPDAVMQTDLGPTRYVCPGEIVELNPGEYAEYLWQDGSTDSVYFAFETGIYTVHVINEQGCQDSASTDVIYSCGDNVWIPTAFSPEGDGLNDFFKPEAPVFEEGNLQVFNRWGQPVFIGDFRTGWDGNYEGEPSPQGIYYYRFRYRLPGDKYRERSGWLTLIR